MRSLNKLLWLQRLVTGTRREFLVRFWGMDIHPSVVISLTAKMDKTYPKGIHIGEETYIAFGAAILAHDMTRGLKLDTVIGRRCFIGARSIILPGITVGDESIVAAGSVVTKDVPSRSIVAGNPARLIKSGIEVGAFGRLRSANDPLLKSA